MISTEEEKKGYYLFESKTSKYIMWYPENTKMDKFYYQRTKDLTEHIDFSGDQSS